MKEKQNQQVKEEKSGLVSFAIPVKSPSEFS